MDDPRGSPSEQRLAAVFASCRERLARGERVDLEQVLRENPDIAPALRRRFAALAAVERALAPRAGAEETSAGGGSAHPSSALAGRTIGRYRLVRELGRGGQASVWLAEDPRLSRHVALKLLEPGLFPSPQSHARFRREAEAAARLDHPDVCAVYDAGVEGDTPYIAMRHVEGRTLADWVDAAADAGSGSGPPRVVDLPGAPDGATGRTPLLRVVALVERVARALHAAHEAGLVHRDVKPANVMVTRDGAPVLLDFGLVRDDAAGRTTTLSGTLVGTPAYMAPEQLLAGRAPVDGRTDVYALAVTLYECLTLRRPFEAPTREALYQQIISCDAPRLRRSNAELPRDLEVVVQKAMEKDPARRYATALEIAEDLRRVRIGEPIRARPSSAVVRVRRWTQRRPMVVAGVVAALATTAVGLNFTRREIARERGSDPGAATPRHGHAAALPDASAAAAAASPDGTLSVLLAREAVRLEPSPPTYGRLRAALSLPRLQAVLTSRADGLAHSGHVLWAEFNASGDRVVTASADRTAAVWDASTGEPLAVLWDHTQAVRTAHFLPEGRRVLTASSDGTAGLWGEDGNLLARLRGHTDKVNDAWISPQGDRIVTASFDKSARIWDLEGRELARLEDHEGPVRHARFSPDGALVTTASNDGTARVWRDGSGSVLASAGPGGVFRVWLSPRGDRVLAGCADGTVRMWDVVSGRELLVAPNAVGGRASVTACGADLWAAWPDDGRTVLLWDLRGTPVATVHKGAESIWAVGVSPDRERILTAGTGRCVRLWDRTGRPLATLAPHAGTVRAAAFSPDGSRIVIASEDGTAQVWHLPPGDLRDGPRADGAPAWRDDELLAATDALGLRDFTREERERYVNLLGPENTLALQAWRELDRLGQGAVLVSELVEKVKADTAMRNDVRSAALRIASRRREDHVGVQREVWRTVRFPGRPLEDYRAALRWSEAGVRLWPEIIDFRMKLGAAQCRAGMYEAALATLERVEALCDERNLSYVTHRAFHAMALAHLGRDEDARNCLARMREQRDPTTRPPSGEEAALMAEAEAVVAAR